MGSPEVTGAVALRQVVKIQFRRIGERYLKIIGDTMDIKQLEEIIDKVLLKFPNELPKKPTEDLSRLIGQQDVIRFLFELLEREEDVPKTIHKR